MPGSAAQRGNEPPANPPGTNASAIASSPSPFPPTPLKPRPLLLAVLSLVFAGWVVFLVALYLKTEYPHRSTAPRPDAKGVLPPDAPSEPAR